MRVLPTEQYFSIVRSELAEKGEAFVRVMGNSMRPILRHLKDGVILIPADAVRAGDIVLFDRKNGRYALHRVIRTKKDGFSMAGDNQWHVEPLLPYDGIVGKAAWIVRGEKRIPADAFSLRLWAKLARALAAVKNILWKIARWGWHKVC